MRNLILLLSLFILACNSSSTNTDLDLELRSLIESNNLTGDPASNRNLPSIDSPLAQLGKKLFFTKTLGGDFDSACVTCHHPLLGGGDALPLSIGVGAEEPDLLGPRRKHHDGDFPVPRNAPSTFNIGLWDQFMFWDGRLESLGKTENANGDNGLGIRTPDVNFAQTDPLAGHNIPTAQARFPVTSKEEMLGFDFQNNSSNEDIRTALVNRLETFTEWKNEFEKVFGNPDISYSKIAAAIGEYERSQVFINNQWKKYLEGDASALNENAKNGALLFFKSKEQGGANCVSCHSGDFFTDEQFYNILSPQIGRGKGDGNLASNDFGRFRETKEDKDKFSFRTPSLLNVEVTGPYLHSGAYFELKDVIKHHLDPITSLNTFDSSYVYPAKVSDYEFNKNELLNHLTENNIQVIDTYYNPLTLSEKEISQLEEFLFSLTDPCTKDKECLEPWIAKDEDNIDGNQLNAIF